MPFQLGFCCIILPSILGNSAVEADLSDPAGGPAPPSAVRRLRLHQAQDVRHLSARDLGGDFVEHGHLEPSNTLAASFGFMPSYIVMMPLKRAASCSAFCQELEQRAREGSKFARAVEGGREAHRRRVEEIEGDRGADFRRVRQKAEQDAARFKGIITMYEGMKQRTPPRCSTGSRWSVLYEIASQIRAAKDV